jgi:adenine-specific DNA-methyltransferase
VLSFETPDALRHDFDLLWQLSYGNIVSGSLDSLSNQRHTEEVDKDYLDFINIWRERLAQDVLKHLKDNPWVMTAEGKINLRLLRDVVQRYIDRLVLIRFAEDHLVIPPGSLYKLYETRRDVPYLNLDDLIDRFFRGFDRDHNSALFTRGVTDEAVFSDSELMALVEKLYAARYRAMPADILGNTYEQYLGKTLVLDGNTALTRDNLETRKKQGSYYTPQVIVRYMVDQSLGRYLYGDSPTPAPQTPHPPALFRGRFFENKASHCLKIETNRGSRSEERCLIQMN